MFVFDCSRRFNYGSPVCSPVRVIYLLAPSICPEIACQDFYVNLQHLEQQSRKLNLPVALHLARSVVVGVDFRALVGLLPVSKLDVPAGDRLSVTAAEWQL